MDLNTTLKIRESWLWVAYCDPKPELRVKAREYVRANRRFLPLMKEDGFPSADDVELETYSTGVIMPNDDPMKFAGQLGEYIDIDDIPDETPIVAPRFDRIIVTKPSMLLPTLDAFRYAWNSWGLDYADYPYLRAILVACEEREPYAFP